MLDEERWQQRVDDRLEDAARVEIARDRAQDMLPAEANPFAESRWPVDPYRGAFLELCDLIEERCQPNHALRIHSVRLRRALERDAA